VHLCFIQQPQQFFLIALGHVFLYSVSADLEFLNADPHQVKELLVESDDIYIISVQVVENDRPKDIVEHVIRVDVFIHEFPDVKLLIGLKPEARQIRFFGIVYERIDDSEKADLNRL
jgi:hypothetical protein